MISLIWTINMYTFYEAGKEWKFIMIDIKPEVLFSVKSLIIYVLAINVIAFLAMGIDKWKAKRGAWRIPESTLFALVLLGGGIGGIAGMIVFHHKTKKPKFQIGFPSILIFEIALVIYIAIIK